MIDLNVYNTLKFTKDGLYQKHPVNFYGTTFFTIMPILFGYLITFLVGYKVNNLVFESFDKKNNFSMVPLLASFPMGYLISISIYRIFGLFIQVGYGLYFSTLIILLLIIFYISKKSYMVIKLKHLSIFLLLLTTLLLISINMGDFTYVGHGPDQYAKKIKDWVLVGKFFPYFNSHYDEPIYHHFIAFPLLASKIGKNLDISNIISWWLTLGLIKTSMFFYLNFVLRLYSIKSAYALAITIFIAFGTFAADPTNYFMLFDSNNPAAFVVHSGRVIPLFIIIFIAHFLFLKLDDTSRSSQVSSKHLNSIFLILIGVGISSTTFTNSFWLYAISFLFFFIYFTKNFNFFNFSKLIFYKEIIFFLPFPLAALLYPNPFGLTSIYFKATLVVISLIILIIAVLPKINDLHLIFFSKANSLNKKIVNFKDTLKSFNFVILGNILGLLFMGNLLSKLMSNLIFWEVAPNTLFSAMKKPIWGIPHSQGTQLFGDYRTLGTFSEYNISSSAFFGYYGILYVFIVILYLINLKTNQLKSISIFYVLILIFYCIFPFLYFFIDYTSIGYNGWVKTRFLEVPVYGMLVFGLVISFTNVTNLYKKIYFSFLILLSIIPFYSTRHFEQIIFNYNILLTNLNL